MIPIETRNPVTRQLIPGSMEGAASAAAAAAAASVPCLGQQVPRLMLRSRLQALSPVQNQSLDEERARTSLLAVGTGRRFVPGLY